MKYEFGTFLDGRYSYVSFGEGQHKYVIFPPTRELIIGLRHNPKKEAKSYRRMFPKSVKGKVYIIGYDPNLTRETWCRDIARDIAGFIQNSIGPADIIGISYGGAIAIPFADLFPTLVKKLVLLVAAGSLSDDGVKLCKHLIDIAQKLGLRETQREIDRLILNPIMRWITQVMHLIEWDIQKISTNSPETFINAYTHISNYPLGLIPHLPRIVAPTLIIGGTYDQFFSKTIYSKTKELISNASLLLVEKGGHPIPLEHPYLVKKAVEIFLKEKDPTMN
jgi:pimeloyl-ACP methyl ester carboxylesterase